jgi:hypothetical protein
VLVSLLIVLLWRIAGFYSKQSPWNTVDPLRYLEGSTRVKISESCIEPGLRICSKLKKNRPLKDIFLKKLCQDMGSEHTSLLYYRTSRWLSRGNLLSRTFELRQEI